MRIIILALTFFSTLAIAAPPPPPTAVPDVPPAPPSVQSGEIMEPGVTIIQSDDKTIYEYRAGANLYMVKIVPKVGLPYYYFDQDGDGDLDFQRDDPRVAKVNQWIMWRW